MMNDIVQRLINFAEKDKSLFANVLYEAAEEIEQLREDLRDAGNGDSWQNVYDTAQEELEHLQQITCEESLVEIIGNYLAWNELMQLDQARSLSETLAKHLSEKFRE